MSEPGRTVGAIVKARRAALGLGQRELSRHIQATQGVAVSSNYITMLEKGQIQAPGAQKLKALARALGLTMEQVTGDAAIPEGVTSLALETTIAARLPPALREAVQEFGADLTPGDWARVAGYLQAVAEDRRAQKQDRTAKRPEPPG